MQEALYSQIGPAAKFGSTAERDELFQQYSDRLITNSDLNRTLVSFQANKQTPFFRWLKYKEAFSSELVLYFLEMVKTQSRHASHLLDPFAGSGTALITAWKAGCRATGIEMLPVGISAVRARLCAERVNITRFKKTINQLAKVDFSAVASKGFQFPHLRITENAFSEQTERAISKYVGFVQRIEDEEVRYLFWFACLSILEDVSFTRKDGQYLRWDYRSGRALKSDFNKGIIPHFKLAISEKLRLMAEDIELRNQCGRAEDIDLREGSCLYELPALKDDAFDLVITSPPYCNRYDYTRTYALELAFMGYDDAAIKNLRQTLLSATVENRSKRDQLHEFYRKINREQRFSRAVSAFELQGALHEILNLLFQAQDRSELNNNNIPYLVQNYFFEMNLMIHELHRVLKPGGKVIMVNDNVQYNGEEVPVDLILSDFAKTAGFDVEHVWILPKGKGNSSQQMGVHGRNEIRKCVYSWKK